MNNKRLTLIITLIMTFAGGQLFSQGMKYGHHMNNMYNPATVEKLSGEITNLEAAERDCCMGNHHGTHITLKTGKETLTVYLGPADFIKDKITLAKGDKIDVTGSRITDGKDAGIIAKEVKKGTVTAVLRKDDGTPLWAGSGMRYHKK